MRLPLDPNVAFTITVLGRAGVAPCAIKRMLDRAGCRASTASVYRVLERAGIRSPKTKPLAV